MTQPASSSAPAIDRPSRVLVAAVLLLALSPVIMVVLTRFGAHYFPVIDQATIDLRVRDVFTAHPPLVGAYSRGFDHPGPILFWALAPLSFLAGGAPWATLVGGALLHGLAILGVAWVALRRGGIALMLLMLAALALVYAALLTSSQFLQTWNPYLAFPFFLLFLLEIWSVALGDHAQLLGAAVLGSVLIQLHVGYLPLVAAATIWLAVVILVTWRTTRSPAEPASAPAWRRALGWSAVATVLLWAPPVIQQVTSDDGNLTALWKYFTSGARVAGLRAGAGLFAAEFKFLPPWLGGRDPLGFGTGTVQPASPWWLIVPVALLVGGYLAARRSGRTDDQRLVELAGVVAAASVVAMARLTLTLSPFLFYFRVVAAVFVVAAAGWAVANLLALQNHQWATRVCAGVLVAAIALGFGSETRDVYNHRHAVERMEPVVENLLAQARARGLPHRPVLVRALGDPNASALDQGLIDGLDRAGVAVKVDPEYGFHFGEQRVATPAQVGQVWYDAEEGRFKSLLADSPGATLLAFWTPLRPAEERELVRLQRSVASELDRAGRKDFIDKLDNPFVNWLNAEAPIAGVDTHELDRIATLDGKVQRSGRCRCSIIAFPGATAPMLPYTHG